MSLAKRVRMLEQIKEGIDRQKGGTRKIADLPQPCRDSGHNPPSMMSFSDGIYEHVCPSCGKSQQFTVRNPSL